ncbi:family 43 glycosylhydrolase [Dysgonomonas sp. ZJ279]|uniref:family 43 glycosylhydrolase n=1 Tax=Dysgonomonas sp. ZJ279 TaxID=2709796 RepID=UPI0013EA8F53|nr:family 43 glycosylhydrolase [Dysgonomonas sp. ZJ279]
MKKLLYIGILCLLSCSLFAQKNIENTYRNPVISGDFPDPTVIRVGNDYYAAGTTSDFAPSYPLYHSKDLVNWDRIGSVFTDPPAWIKGDCWAPELFYNDGTFYVYYTARRKSDNITCIGVATTKDITKGFTDHGIIVDWGKEAIDAYINKDDDGKLYITWKAYGLDDRPIELLGSELSADGLSLVGEPFSISLPSKGWIERGDEGQCIVKHNGYYYMLYSIGGCCDFRCDYRVHVARSKSLKGDWEQYEPNPILEGGNLWNCSGHGTLVQTPDGRYFYLYHAYQTYDFDFVGRQGLLDEMLWDETTGWPYFKNGNTPTAQAPVPFEGTVQKRQYQFHDNFTTAANDQYWLWDMNLPKPEIIKGNDKMTMRVTENNNMVFRGINPKTGNYVMQTEVENTGSNLKGLAVYGNKDNLFVWGLSGSSVKLYKYVKGVKTELFSKQVDAKKVALKVQSVNARSFRFSWSADPKDWTSFPEGNSVVDGGFLPQWGKGVRVGLFVNSENGNDSGTFSYFTIDNKF